VVKMVVKHRRPDQHGYPRPSVIAPIAERDDVSGVIVPAVSTGSCTTPFPTVARGWSTWWNRTCDLISDQLAGDGAHRICRPERGRCTDDRLDKTAIDGSIRSLTSVPSAGSSQPACRYGRLPRSHLTNAPHSPTTSEQSPATCTTWSAS
jgi:hypothetical protein